ncbi:sushi domain-containing protein 3-like isoform 4-T4 [Salvelinus alpinus]|uniref:sushi domain-containing protein 3-like isoform X4 n=1 Tax=Salvelinus alpinus TaxID=8036 RepID=UPI0039FCF738
MSTVTASVVDVSRTIYSTKNGNRGRNYTGQCTPMPQPALGTQKIIQGNGTNVGTVITLQCPSRHRLVGGNEVSCVWGSNSTQWSGGSPWCKPVSPSEDFGFRVAVVASIISCAIILLMSIAFITCCLLDCVTEEEKKKEERYHQYPYALTGPVQASTTGPALNSAPLPCRGYNQPILPHNSGLYHNPGLPHNPGLLQNPIPTQYPGPPQTTGLVQNQVVPPGSGLVRQYGGQEGSVSPLLEKPYRMCRHPLYVKERPVRVISV